MYQEQLGAQEHCTIYSNALRMYNALSFTHKGASEHQKHLYTLIIAT